MSDRYCLPRILRLFRRRAIPEKDTAETKLLLPATELLGPKNPPPGLLCRIEEEIDALDTEQRSPESGRSRVSRSRKRHPVLLTGVLSGAVASALLFVFFSQTVFGNKPTPIAAMAGPAGAAVVKADNMGDRHYLIVEFQAMAPDQDGTLELWAIPKESAVARSLGLLTEKGEVTILALVDPLEAGDVLALSREPEGGAPGAGPSGPVLMTYEIR